jgi:hypothetical protein
MNSTAFGMAGAGCRWPWGAASRSGGLSEASGQQYDVNGREGPTHHMPTPEVSAPRQPLLETSGEIYH